MSENFNNQKYLLITVLFRLIISIILCVGGIFLVFAGLSGSAEIIIDAKTITAKIVNASPGLLFAISGAWLAIHTHYNVQIANLNKKNGTKYIRKTYLAGRALDKNEILSDEAFKKRGEEAIKSLFNDK